MYSRSTLRTSLFINPVNIFVAGFIGSAGDEPHYCDRQEKADDGVYVTTEARGPDLGLRLPALPPDMRSSSRRMKGKQLVFGLRPQDIHDARFAQGMLDEDESPRRPRNSPYSRGMSSNLMGSEVDHIFLATWPTDFIDLALTTEPKFSRTM